MSERLRRLLPEFLVCLAFLGLTAVMTWPWVLHLRDHCSDTGDPYLVSWTLWWDFHQTFHDPLHLFDGNVFFPMKYSLAFSEHNYGIALPFFPLFALGVRPLTVHGLAMLLGFALAGYGDVPAHPHAHGLDGRGVGRGNRLRLRAVSLRSDAAPAVPVLGLDSDPARGARPLRARKDAAARGVARARPSS